MNKEDLVNTVSEKSGLAKKDSTAAVSATLEAIKEALAKGERVQLIGFGTFDVFERAARTGINPQTKEKMQIPAKKVIRFRAGKTLKDAIAESQKPAWFKNPCGLHRFFSYVFVGKKN